LLHTWLRDSRESRELHPDVRQTVRQHANALLLRERLLDGTACDFVGADRGVLFVDVGREGRKGRTTQFLIAEAFHRLRAQTDLAVAWFGRAELFAPTDDDALTPERLRQGHNHPRLMMPLLEKLDPDRTHFVLLPHWGPIADGADALADDATDPTAARWRGRLVPLSLDVNQADVEDFLDLKPAELATALGRLPPGMALYVQWVLRVGVQNAQVNQRNIERLFDNLIHPQVEPVLARRLAERSPERWRALVTAALAPLGVAAENPHAVARFLTTAAGEVDAAAPGGGTVDRLRTVLSALQGLAATRLDLAVQVVVKWIGAAGTRTLGVSAAQALLRVRVEPRLDARGRIATRPADDDPVWCVFQPAPGLAAHELDPRPYAKGATHDVVPEMPRRGAAQAGAAGGRRVPEVQVADPRRLPRRDARVGGRRRVHEPRQDDPPGHAHHDTPEAPQRRGDGADESRRGVVPDRRRDGGERGHR